MQRVLNRTESEARPSHARMQICEVELKKAAALLRKERREEGEAKKNLTNGAGWIEISILFMVRRHLQIDCRGALTLII